MWGGSLCVWGDEGDVCTIVCLGRHGERVHHCVFGETRGTCFTIVCLGQTRGIGTDEGNHCVFGTDEGDVCTIVCLGQTRGIGTDEGNHCMFGTDEGDVCTIVCLGQTGWDVCTIVWSGQTEAERVGARQGAGEGSP